MGVNLGDNMEKINNNIDLIRSMEMARYDLLKQDEKGRKIIDIPPGKMI